MTQMTGESTQKRLRRTIDRNETFSEYFEQPPAITYGRRLKPLPLKGTHFRQRDPYEIPPNSDEENNDAVSNQRKAHKRNPDPDDSPLSEDDLEAVYGRNASPLGIDSDVSTSDNKTSIDLSKTVKKQRPMKNTASARNTRSQHFEVVGARNEHCHKFNNARTDTVQRARQRRRRIRTPPRRLPENELVLVASPSRNAISQEPPSSYHGVQTQDPISDGSHASQKRTVSLIEDDSDLEKKAPLTSIRKRLKAPKFTHNSVIALCKKQSNYQIRQREIGDGFEVSELQVDHILKPGRHRKAPKSLVLGFSALNLKSGPLPDVKFESSSSELKLEREQDEDAVRCNDDHGAVETTEQEFQPEASSVNPSSRKVGLSDRVLDEMVMKQLSSVSAPRRVYSISSDDSDDGEQDFEETDDEDEQEEEDAKQDFPLHGPDSQRSEDDGVVVEPERSRPMPTPPSNQRARQNSSFWRREPSLVTPAPVKNAGVTLDFRKPAPPGLAKPPTPFSKRNLVEVDDIIYDEPDRPLDQHPPSEVNEDEEMLDDEPSEALFPGEPPSQVRHPRSILRNDTPHYQASDTRPEHTASNTRRNSMITLDEESRYFATATDMLQQQTTSFTKPRVLKHRSSQLRRGSNYWDQYQPKEIQVLDSESRVMETSPEPPDYINSTQMNMLKKSSEAMWTSSQSLPKEPRDLKTLTRTVSREHGTMSQSMRRRPSLPFQSPTKVKQPGRRLID